MTDKLKQNPQPELSERDAELLSAYIDEMLSVDEQAELEARLLKDAFLRNELSAMRQTVSWMNALPTLKAPRDFTISAKDVAPAEEAVERKVIPMQNRNLWYMASAAAVLVVIIGFGAVASLFTDNNAPQSGESVDIVAFSSTENAPQAMTVDTADSDAYDDTAFFGADSETGSDFAEESTAGLANTANIQEQAPAPANTSRSATNDEPEQSLESTATPFTVSQGGSASNSEPGIVLTSTMVLTLPDDTGSENSVSLSVVQLTATTLAPLFASTPDSPTSVLAYDSGQGGGIAPTSLPELADSAPLAPSDSPAEAPVMGSSLEEEAQDEVATTGDILAESDDTVENEERDGTVASTRLNQPSNLILAVLDAVQSYIESLRQ